MLAWIALAGVFYLSQCLSVPSQNRYYQPIQTAAMVPEQLPADNVNYQAFDQGLGIGLVVFGDYLELLNATAQFSVDWRFIRFDEEYTRLEGPGISIYAKRWSIWQWSIDLDYVFSHDDASWLRDKIAAAGFSPDLTWTAVTGTPWTGDKSREHLHIQQQLIQTAVGSGYPAYVLVFKNGRLSRIEGRLEIQPHYYDSH